jgi:hypothetical protein
MLELLTGQPAPMRQRPMAASAVNQAMPQQEGKKLLALTASLRVSDLSSSLRFAVGACPEKIAGIRPCQPHKEVNLHDVGFGAGEIVSPPALVHHDGHPLDRGLPLPIVPKGRAFVGDAND